MTYHVVIDGQAAGPYTLNQLIAINITEQSLVWYEGLPNWVAAGTVPEIAAALAAKQQNYNQQYAVPQQPVYPSQPQYQPQQVNVEESRPSNYLPLAIIAIAMFFPTGIPAIIKSTRINSLWNNGQKEEAIAQSQSVRRLGILSIILGAVFNTIFVIAELADSL